MAWVIRGVLVVFNGELRVLAVVGGALPLGAGDKRSRMLLTAAGAGLLAVTLFAAY
ncbi:hypothetical protein WBG99_11805 [Streptomyces sp. TG1A-60]|uniref:hypothetical protein n=1 Tax=Streptomyces sp. TG1A-60 TaxID=3129111 RepID=UPI0030D38DE9